MGRGEYEAAVDYLEQALAIAREVGDRFAEGGGLTYLGQVALRRGQFEAAEGYLQQALPVLRESDDHLYEAQAFCSLSRVAEAAGDLVSAETMCRRSLALATDQDLGPEIAQAQFALGMLLAKRLERPAEGCPLLREAAQRFAEMDMPEAAEARSAVEQFGCEER
jgi:tetratricopeptide (TPR) repeat protein